MESRIYRKTLTFANSAVTISRNSNVNIHFESLNLKEVIMKKVIIVGAGAQGNVISGILAKAPEVSKIMLVDLDVERAAEVAQFINSDKIDVEKADASDKSQLVATILW
jgi:threonine dehydrogenase-like Zn-dependent dehydrogenase